jgi:hypothetical protein
VILQALSGVLGIFFKHSRLVTNVARLRMPVQGNYALWQANCRNVPAMKHSQFLLLLLVAAAGARSQSSNSNEAALEHRRAELRSTLKGSGERAQPDPAGKANEAAIQVFNPIERHLSAQERADLRRQLGQQRVDATSAPPSKQK